MFTSHITDYLPKTAAVEAYLAWLRRCEAKLADRPTPETPLGDAVRKESRGEARRRILAQI